MKTYKERKEEARQKAIDWQNSCAVKVYSWSEMMYWSDYFQKLGKRYGLLKEFQENGIC